MHSWQDRPQLFVLKPYKLAPAQPQNINGHNCKRLQPTGIDQDNRDVVQIDKAIHTQSVVSMHTVHAVDLYMFSS